MLRFFVPNLQSRNWTTQRLILIFHRKSGIFTECIVRHHWYVRTALRKSSAHRHIFTTNLRETIHPEAINSNSAIAQAYYAKKQGLKGVTTETGAGQWGTALSMACSYFDLDCQVYMVKVSYEQKPFRREVMRTYGAKVTPSPSMNTEVRKKNQRRISGNDWKPWLCHF